MQICDTLSLDVFLLLKITLTQSLLQAQVHDILQQFICKIYFQQIWPETNQLGEGAGVSKCPKV